MYAWHCHVRQRLGAASVYLVIYAAISFLHLLKIKSLGGGQKHTSLQCHATGGLDPSGLLTKSASASVSPSLITTLLRDLQR